MKICLITPGHISTNPRLVKEALTLVEENYAVHIIFTQYIEKLIIEDLKILKQNPSITYDVLNWTGNNLYSKISRLMTGLIQKFCIKISPILASEKFSRVAINRNFNWQMAKANAKDADLYIAHNLGALPIAVNAAKKSGKFSGFDAEDFHRFETLNDVNHPLVRLAIKIENAYIPKVSYLTAASPMIAAAYEKIFQKKIIHILNVFPKEELIPKFKDEIVKLFWFSQTVGPGRGIETIFNAILMLNNQNIEFHLLGEINVDYRQSLSKLLDKHGEFKSKIFFHESISPSAIINFARQFDIGIASEIDNPMNRDICLTNKIFTYIQSGLALIASDTKAQAALLNENKNMGFLYEKNSAKSLYLILFELLNNKSKLEAAKQHSENYSKNVFNWEIEQKKFSKIISSLSQLACIAE